MGTNSVAPAYYADFGSLGALKQAAKADAPGALRQAARQFESLFTSMMLKAMREAKLGDSLGDSQETDLYQSMFDQQLAVQLSQGKGLGLADLLVQQLSRAGVASTPATSGPALPPAASPGAIQGPPTAGGASAVGAGAAATSSAQRRDFVGQIAPAATRAAAQLGVSANALIAQAALETGWGRHMPSGSGPSSQNLFGVKAGGTWSGPAVAARTGEFVAGRASTVTQSFRSYDSAQQSVDDYVALLRNSPRYSQALGTGEDVHAFAGALVRGGYATDPDYVRKLAATAEQVKQLRADTAATPLNLVAGQPITPSREST